jgi:outer membrane protein assembly factor BamA
MGSSGKEFVTGSFDFRHYIGFGRDYSFAFRITGGASFGKNPTLFILGGVDNWLNYKFSDKIDAFSIPDYFLSDLMTPLRGARLYELIGSRAALVNMEFRFPFIQYLITRFPLPLGFQNIQGVGFFDAGTAWTEDKNWRFTDKKANGDRYLRDITTGFGYGLRINLYFLLLKFDVAFRTDFDDISKPIHYYSIGLDF